MKRFVFLLLITALLLSGCAGSDRYAQVAATTLPVYEFTMLLCQDTPITVTRLVTEEVSCLHDYSLNVKQVKAAEAAEMIVISGAGLEDFMADLLTDKPVIDASEGVQLLCPEEEADHQDHSHEGHHHEQDPHLWLSPELARVMVSNIFNGLSQRYPEYIHVFAENEADLMDRLLELESYGKDALASLSCREMITFHDGFAYLAQAFDLQILEAVEEESGSEASAQELIHLIEEVEHHQLPAIFTEVNGSVSAADIISRETGAGCYALDMIMSGDSYFDAMYRNIDTLKEALG